MKLTLYGKPGCCLCDEAKTAIEEVAGEVEFELEQVDVSLDPVLYRAYGERIPVIDIDGEEAFELGVDAAALRRRLSTLSLE